MLFMLCIKDITTVAVKYHYMLMISWDKDTKMVDWCHSTRFRLAWAAMV